MAKTVVFAVSGTGGHLFPAQALARKLSEEVKECNIHFAGEAISSNPYFYKEFPYTDISSATFSGISLKTFLGMCRLTKGVCEAVSLLRALRPTLVIGFGSFHSVPVLVAAKLLRIPIVLHESNALPGKVTRCFSPYALWTGIFFKETEKHLKGKVHYVDIPLRTQFEEFAIFQDEARRHYSLDPDLKTLLIFGGSQGARSINQLVIDALPLFPKNIQVIHCTGKKVDSLAEKYQEQGIRAAVLEFEPNIHYAWAAADAVIARAGAVTIAEALFLQKPLLSIPYPYAYNHQEYNAKYFEEVIRGGKFIREKEAAVALFTNELREFLEDANLKRYRENMASCDEKAAQGAFLRDIIELLSKR